jgi:hypothetical protein
LRPVTIQGPGVQGKKDGQNVIFDKLTLQANQTAKYEIRAEGVKAGDVRFEARLTADILQTPVTETESTTVVDPNVLPKLAPPAVVTPNIGNVSLPGGRRIQSADAPAAVPLLPPPPAPPEKH